MKIWSGILGVLACAGLGHAQRPEVLPVPQATQPAYAPSPGASPILSQGTYMQPGISPAIPHGEVVSPAIPQGEIVTGDAAGCAEGKGRPPLLVRLRHAREGACHRAHPGVFRRLAEWLCYTPAKTKGCGCSCCGARQPPLYLYFQDYPCLEGCGLGAGCAGGCRTGHAMFSSPTGHGCVLKR